MAERCVKGDYIGFTFGDVHSSELGLMRVSNGSRYEQDLLPPLQDKTAQVNGRDGAVYFGSQYNTKPIKVPVAFDNMTEESFNRLKRLLQDKKPKYLWFDETPYKQWLVKSANVQNFKWVCFDESKNIERQNDGDPVSTKKRIYKGEGTLEFSCFSPYAESRVTFLDDEIESILTWDELKEHKKIKKTQKLTPYLYVSMEEKSYRENFSQEEVKNKFSLTRENYLTWAERFSEMGYNVYIPKNFSFGQSKGFFGYGDGTLDEVYCYFITEEQELAFFEKNNQSLFPLKYRVDDNQKPLTFQAMTQNGTNTTLFLTEDNTDRQDYFTLKATGNNTKRTSVLFYKKDDKLIFIEPSTGKQDESYWGYFFYQDGKQAITLEDSYNYSEWRKNSRLRFRAQDFGVSGYYHEVYSHNTFPDALDSIFIDTYNAGDIDANLEIVCYGGLETETTFSIHSSYDLNFNEHTYLKIKPFKLLNIVDENGDTVQEDGFIIDSKLKLIKGMKNGKPTHNTYNKYISKGDFFKVPQCSDGEYYTIKINNSMITPGLRHKHYYI